MTTPMMSESEEMLPIPARMKALSRSDWDAYRETAARYEAAWADSGDPPAMDDFLPAPGASRSDPCC